MAGFKRKGNYQTSQSPIDASYGLIYRLNYLWLQADFAALAGDFDKWGFILDRIYSNLLYRDKMEIVYANLKGEVVEYPSDNDHITEIKLTREDGLVYEKFRKMISEIKNKKLVALRTRNKKEYHRLVDEHYRVLMLKDIWLRKFMQDRGLYLKEIDFDPTKAMWGG